MPGNDDEDDSCVLIGTPLTSLFTDDTKFSNKPKRPEEQIVTDEKGRQRFHGAFTGGYSAGYFNTVGTKEGWQPATFKSSRSEKLKEGQSKGQRPEDFMDEEDFGEFGIAPKLVSIKSDYKDHPRVHSAEDKQVKNKFAFAFDDFITPVRGTIGVRMLKKMGWREGQGIGPKIKRKLRKLKAKQKTHEPGRKIYGVTLPSDNEISDIEDEDEDYLVSAYDVNEFRFEIKEDLFGLGYRRLDVNDLYSLKKTDKESGPSSIANILFPELSGQKKSSKKGIRGQAFGVGEYEDEEDVDIYRQDNMENYDFNLDSKHEREKKEILNKSYGFDGNDLHILKKFSVSSKKQDPAKVFKAPEVPKDFNLIHKFANGEQSVSTATDKNDSMTMYLKSATERSEVLGEEAIKPDSVFDLLNQKDKDKLKQEKLKQNLKSIANELKSDQKEPEIVTPKAAVVEAIVSKSTREQRYEQFLNYLKKNYKDPYSFVDTQTLTEWEKEKEKDEFYKKYEEQTKKMESVLNVGKLKFVSTHTLTKDNDEVEIVKKSETSIEKAASEKKYGKLTRVEYEWRPHNTLCKRFNVPNPYPEAKECGTVGAPSKPRMSKEEKFSIFSYLTNEAKFESTDKAKPQELNIINKDDLETSESRIEFESKKDEQKHEQKMATVRERPVEVEKKKPEEKSDLKNTINKENVYLQERPEIDIFKAIFDEDEDEEAQVANPEEPKGQSSEDEIMEDKDTYVEPSVVIPGSKIGTAIPSSINVSSIDYKNLNRYLNEQEDEENDKSKKFESDFYDPKDYEKIEKKEKDKDRYGPSLPIVFSLNKGASKSQEENPRKEQVKFLTLVKQLATLERSKSKQDEKESSSDSRSSDDDVIFIEKTVDGEKSSSKKNKKKKHKKHHKKSKKSK